jgi:hypothetical protein
MIAGSVCAQPKENTARKFDEFGDVQYSDLIARLDNFAIALQGEPNAKGFIVAYRSHRDLPGLSNRIVIRSKAYLVNSRGVSSERLATVDGGEADHLSQELWIVPPGTTLTPRGDAYPRSFPDLDSPRKFDEYGYGLEPRRGRGGDSKQPGAADYLESFAIALRGQKNYLAYIIAYAHFSKRRQLVGDESYDFRYESRLDPAGTARKRLLLEKKRLTEVFGIAPARIRLIDGGYRKWRGVELWIVPPGEHAPTATPNSFPPRRKRPR